MSGKNVLKRIVPATYSKVENANKKLCQELEHHAEKSQESVKAMIQDAERKTEEELRAIRRRLKRLEQSNSSSFCEIDKRLEILEQGESSITEKIQEGFSQTESRDRELCELLNKTGHRYLYNNNYEREAIASFYEMYERKDFKEIFLKLIRGLEKEDIAKISLILQRQRMAKDSVDQDVDLFTPEEQKQILDVKRYLSSQIFRVAEDMYCYKHYLLPVRHFEASVFYYKHGIDCIQDLSAVRDKDILDVGGFIGDSILVLKPLTDKRVISFEAVSKNFELMKRTVEINQLEQVVLEKMALGSRRCQIDIELAGSSSSFAPNEVVPVTGEEKVQVDTLDSYIENSDMDLNVGLIKVDIEGAEQDFLAGARKTIERFRPVLLISIYHNADDFFNIKPIIESWNLGYRFRIHKPVDFSVSREVLLIAEIR